MITEFQNLIFKILFWGAIAILVCWIFSGCSTFKFSPLATIEINDSPIANGNTVPVSAAP